MQRTIIIILLLTLSLKGFSTELDTLDYWHVYYNDKVIAKFNSGTNDLNVILEKSNINPKDTLAIRHGDDTPCPTCTFHIIAMVNGKQIIESQTKKFWNKITFSISDLLEQSEQKKSQKFEFYYYECDGGIEIDKHLILELQIE